MKKKLIIAAVIIAVFYLVIVPVVIVIIHSIVMGRYDYGGYASDSRLLYSDVADSYPREVIPIPSGKETLSAYLYGANGTKGLIVVAPGHGDPNDVKLYEIRYFVDAGYKVLCFDYTGCYASSGDSFGGYTQAVYDLDAVLTYIEGDASLCGEHIYLFGHSLGGYAVTAVLNYGHRVDAVVSASGFDNASDQWECSVRRFTGPAYHLIAPVNRAFISIKYGADKDLSAVDGINRSGIPVLVISADDDVYYGGKRSPIYDKMGEVTNERCEFRLMDRPRHNEHYTYFLTDAAIDYQESDPQGTIDKELYFQHDTDLLADIVGFYERTAEKDE